MQAVDFGIIIGVVVFFVVANALLVWVVMRKARSKDDGLSYIQRELQDMRQTFDTRLGENSRELNASVRQQLAESTRIVREVTEGLTKLGETNKQVISFSEQLKNLQQVLQNPKQRGVLGEYYLETVLQNVLPPDGYKVQYMFTDGEIVDAAVFVKDKIVPIDSKFSLENYNRMIEAEGVERATLEKSFVNDLKLRVKETSKYIRPAEGTTEFVFMFIPSEGIYYDLLTNKVGSDENILERAAREYKVIVVSPTSFLAYLQTVLQGLKALEVEERAQDIIKNVAKLAKHISVYEQYYNKLGTTLGTAVSHYNTGYKELAKIDKDVFRISGEHAVEDTLELDKPHVE